jgi:hypothetical protein
MRLRVDLQCGREGVWEVLLVPRRIVLSLVFLRMRSRARIGTKVGVWYLYVELRQSVECSISSRSTAYRQVSRPP